MRTLLALLLFAAPAYAGDWRLLDLREFGMEYYSIADHRDSYMGYADPDDNPSGDEAWVGGVAANYTLDLVMRRNIGLYWDNSIHGEGTNSQFREVGWRYELGAQLGDSVQLFWKHHSRHVLDAQRSERFPLDNFYGLRVVFYRRPK
jgi:hypothetical protein